MEELIPAAFFIVWFLFSAIAGKGKREEARKKAEAQRAQQAAERKARAEQRRAAAESREAGGRRTFPAERDDGMFTGPASSGGGSSAGTGSGAAPDSLDMIPDELWNILTGGAPRPTRPEPSPTSHTEPQPVGEGGWVTSPPWDEEDAVNSIEGVSAETGGEDLVDYDDDASRFARARYEDLRATTWDDKPSRDSFAVRESETSDERHFAFHDKLSDFEIGRAARIKRVSARERLGLRSLADVRRAVILAEIIGPPRSLQTSFTEGWRGERPPRPRKPKPETPK